MVKAKQEIVEIKPIVMQTVNMRIEGDTPLIMHKWTEKAKRQMLENQQGKSKGKAKEPKNPVEDFITSMYWLTPMPTEYTEEAFEKAIAEGARFGFQASAFKQAAISAAYRQGWVKDKVSLRGAFSIKGDEDNLVEIESDTPILREDMVRVGMTTDIRYRGEFRHWKANLTVSYNINGQYSLDAICNMINAGGIVCGVGEWRPEKDGNYGTYHLALG